MIQERIIIQRPSAGFPKPNNPNRKTQAIMLNNITFLMPNFLRKNGMVRMNSVSEIWEMDMMMAGYLTASKSWNAGIFAKSCKKVSPYALVNCREAPSNMAKMKKTAILTFLKSAKAFNPSALTKDFLYPFPSGGHFGKVKE